MGSEGTELVSEFVVDRSDVCESVRDSFLSEALLPF